MTEADGSAQPMYPQEARIRNLTYVFRTDYVVYMTSVA
jgi:hypothetical protein